MDNRSSFPIVFIMIALLFVLLIWLNRQPETNQNYSYGRLMEDVAEKRVQLVKIRPNKEVPTGAVEVSISGVDDRRTFYTSDVEKVQAYLADNGIDPIVENIPKENVFLVYILPVLANVIVLVFFFVIFMNFMDSGASGMGGGGNNKMMNFGKSRARMLDAKMNKFTFADVAGLNDEKEDMEEIVHFLKEPERFIAVGARIPKGVLLEGPPGTGKTLLAKAIAGEAGVPFYTISGSDFVEMFVGVGASRVRDLFADAKKDSPCMIFIDEIDAVARRRGTGMGGGHDEREQTLNQLLVEMDGFGTNEGVIVLAATNRVDTLDPAILRPGRFDRKLVVSKPDVRAREEILKVHAKNKPLAEDVELDQIARTTAGFTGADLENLLNESAIRAGKENRQIIVQDDIRNCFVKVGIGTERKSRIISDKEKRITAYHEAGHAILFHALPDVGPVYSVSIIPTGSSAAGYTMPLPEKDEMFLTRGKMLQDIMVSLGGRIAEEIIFEDVTTGASGDIKHATRVARHMVTRYGMSENLGLLNYDDEEDEVFIGRDLAHARPHSELVCNEIDKAVKKIVDDCYIKAKEVVEAHIEILHKCAALLLDREKINRTEFESLFEA